MTATLGAPNGLDVGLIVTAFGFGFRHGIDWDHIAALTDITSSQDQPRRSIWFATLYALGHAMVVFSLGVAAIVFAQRLPAGVDSVMERFVGATLIVLALYVFSSLARHGRNFRMRSRWMLLLRGVRNGAHWMRARVHDRAPAELEHVTKGVATTRTMTPDRHSHRHPPTMSEDRFANYAPRTAFAIGLIHGIGAETPTQVLIFVAAAGAGGKGAGVLVLMCFVVGLLSSNSLIALAGSFGVLGAAQNFRLYVALSCVIAVFSLVVGTAFLLGRVTVLPALFGG